MLPDIVAAEWEVISPAVSLFQWQCNCFRSFCIVLLQDLQQQVEALKRSPDGQQLAALQNENAELRLELDMKQRQLEAATGAAPQHVTARPLAAADLAALDTGKCFTEHWPTLQHRCWTMCTRVRSICSRVIALHASNA